MTRPDEALTRAPLHGVRVLDLTRLLPGPMATLILADMGARIDKLEDPGPGDYLRHMPPQIENTNTSGTYFALNRDKRAGVLDLKRPEGVATLRRMLASYDVVIESFRPGVLARLGLSHEAMLEANPRLIVCAITGYGQNGPLAQRAGHDLNYLARAGVLGVSGPDDRPPAVSGAQMADVAGGALWAVTGILGALVARVQTGRGRVVDIAMCEGSMPLAGFSLGMFFADGEGPPRGASYLNGGIAAYNTYRTSDARYVSLGALEAKFWNAFCRGVGIEASMDALLPGPHQAEWKERLAGIFATRTRAEWETFATQHDCCLEPVLEPRELPTDPQHAARKIFFDVEGVKHFRTPVGAPDAPHTLARAPGADSEAILRDAGLDDAEIATLKTAGVLGV